MCRVWAFVLSIHWGGCQSLRCTPACTCTAVNKRCRGSTGAFCIRGLSSQAEWRMATCLEHRPGAPVVCVCHKNPTCLHLPRVQCCQSFGIAYLCTAGLWLCCTSHLLESSLTLLASLHCKCITGAAQAQVHFCLCVSARPSNKGKQWQAAHPRCCEALAPLCILRGGSVALHVALPSLHLRPCWHLLLAGGGESLYCIASTLGPVDAAAEGGPTW